MDREAAGGARRRGDGVEDVEVAAGGERAGGKRVHAKDERVAGEHAEGAYAEGAYDGGAHAEGAYAEGAYADEGEREDLIATMREAQALAPASMLIVPERGRTRAAVIASLACHATLACALLLRPAPPSAPKRPQTVRMHLVSPKPKAIAAAAPEPAVAPAPPPPAPAPKLAPPPKPTPKAVAAKPRPRPRPKALPTPPPKLLTTAKPATRPVAPAPAKPPAKTVETAVATPKKPAPSAPTPATQAAAAVAIERRGAVARDGSEEVDDDDPSGGADLHAEPVLIRTSLRKPTYTEDALSAHLEGVFALDVQLDAEGRVLVAKLLRKIGFGMDERIVAAMRAARFTPGRDGHGRPQAGWTKVKFKLEIPD
jgi:TonB family protein